jgi:hypothetical protein
MAPKYFAGNLLLILQGELILESAPTSDSVDAL